ncbi:septal ring lytic transglycosylase RlpA family protein [Noviherbaspirillum galbum]|nr:septal ring lytic transglycosylase RlpA family protein [Noviherbaspirillum galbum]
MPRAGSGRGGYYQDDGPGDNPPEGLMDLPDAEPRVEPYRPQNSRPYTVLGTTYVPQVDDKPFRQRGIGSWYGKKFHGQKTASGEPYDMYKMTAAHPTLPIPSYARVTNLSNGKQVIVKINDRGPFHSSRIIDLSFTAAFKLGYLGSGSGMLEVERLLPEEIARMNANPAQAASQPKAPPAAEVMTVAAIASPQPAREVPVIETKMDAREKAEPAADPKVQAAETPSSAPGFYLQLGSFSQAANAQAARNRLLEQLGSSLPGIEAVPSGAWHKVFGGPYANRQEAMAAAARLQANAGIKTIIVQR